MRFMKRLSIIFILGLGAVAFVLPMACRSVPDVYVLPDTPPSDREGQPPPPLSSATSGCPPEMVLPEPCFTLALQDFEQERRDQARLRFRELRERFPETLWATRAAFKLGILALEDKSGEAVDFLKQAMDLAHVQDYALIYHAQAYRQERRFAEAVASYDKLIADYPDSALKPAAVYQRALTLAEASNCTQARMGLEDFTARYPSDAEVPEALTMQADCSLELGEPIRAVEVLRRLWTQYPDHSTAQEVEKAFTLVRSIGVTIPEPTPEERYQRGRTLFKAARYEEARVQFLTLSGDPQGQYRDEATVKLAMTLIQLKRYDEARRVLEEYMQRQPPSSWILQALSGLSRIAVRQSDFGRLLDVEKKLANQFPQSTERAQVLVFIGNFYEDQKQPERALTVYQQVLTEFAQEPAADDALWRIGWMAYAAGRYEETVKTFSSYPISRSNNGYRSQLLYWTGRSAENLGQISEAAAAYEKVCNALQRTYYCQMARERLTRLSPEFKETAQSVAADSFSGGRLQPVMGLPALPLGESSAALLLDPHYQTARELQVLGLDEEAAGELGLLTERYVADRPALLELAGLLYRAGDYYRSLRLLRLYFPEVLERGADTIPATFWEQAFPLRVVEFIKRQAPRGAADPFVVAAVMREESAFDPKAVSTAGAVGLMQLMPFTGQWVAERLGREAPDPQQLFNPDVNIQLGSWYLGHLARQFNSNLILTIASYNAGPEVVARWAEARPPLADAPDEFIESIPFSETRSFTKRVLRSYTEYLRLAGLDPAQRFTRPILPP